MKLSDSHTMRLIDSRSYMRLINEEGEAPRWEFDYDEYDHDPSPDILLLGSYRHPRTGNYLVGGINLHYLSKKSLNDLASVLPQVMDGDNLRDRYWNGRRLLPAVFRNYYRTYNAEFIRGVKQNIMYPKYGYIKAARNWISKSISKLLGKKQQPPKYASDLENMNTTLNDVVADLQRRRIDNSPEARAAKRNALNQRRLDMMRDPQMVDAEITSQADDEYRREIDAQENNLPLKQDTDVAPDLDYIAADDVPPEPLEQPMTRRPSRRQRMSPDARETPREPQYEPEQYEPEPVEYEPEPVEYEPEPVEYEPEPVEYEPEPVEYEPEPVEYEPEPVEYEPELSPRQRAEIIDDTYQENQEELLDPNNEIDLEESIVYYCPIHKSYIIEHINY